MPIDFVLEPIHSSTRVVDPSGVMDSTSGVQFAIHQLKAADGGRLIVPPGTYRLNSSGLVTNAPVGIKDLHAAVKIDSGNIEILAQNPANPPLFFTDETFTSPVNSTILFLFYIPDGGSAFSQLKLTHLKFQGPLLTSASQFPGGPASYGLVVFFGQAWNQRLSHITVQHCTFNDPVRYAIDFEHCSYVSVTHSHFHMFERYAYNDLFPNTIHPAIIVALFAAQNGIEHATIDACFFDGRAKALSGYNPAQPYPTRFGADGFVFFQKGGNVTLTNNVIRRYYLEGVQTNAGPSYVNHNTFETYFSTGVAYMAYADTNNIMPGATPYILQRLYHFKHNTVNGGSLAVKFAGISYPQLPTENEAPQITGVVENNPSIRLNTQTYQPYTLGVFAGGADSVAVKNNTFHDCGMMFHAAIDPGPEVAFVLTDFRCREIIIEDNQFLQNGPNDKSNHCIFFQFPLRNNGVAQIGRNTLARRSANYNHIRLGGTNLPKKSKLPKIPPQTEYPPLPPVGQIKPGILYKVYVPPMQSGSITYGGVTYSHGATFTGSPSFTYFQTSGAAQVRHASNNPPVSQYTVKIGTSQTNKNTYKLGASEEAAVNRFIYYNPGGNDVLQTVAEPGNSPADGVSVQDY